MKAWSMKSMGGVGGAKEEGALHAASSSPRFPFLERLQGSNGFASRPGPEGTTALRVHVTEEV